MGCTTIRESKAGLEVLGGRRADLPEGVVADLASAETAAAAKQLCAHHAGKICVAIPSDKVLLRVVELPTVDPAEMRGMAELQVDKFSPFPVEHTAVSLELLSQTEKSSRVLIAAVKREIIDAVGAAFGKAGIIPHWIDVEVMGWWYLLKQAGEIPDRGRRVLLLLDKTCTDVIVSQDGVPVVFRSLGTGRGVSAEDFHTELAEEIGYTMTALEAEWGALETMKIGLWLWPAEAPPKMAMAEGVPADAAAPAAVEPPPGLIPQLTEACGLDVEVRSLATLASLSEGLARRTAARAPMTLDLAPPEWHVQEQTKRTQKTLLIASAVFGVMWLIGISILLSGGRVSTRRIAALKASVEKLEKPAQEVSALTEKVASLEQFADRTHSALECLRDICQRLPDGIDLTSFSYRKGGNVSLRGDAGSAETVYSFFEALQQSTLYASVKAGEVKQRPGGGRPEFTVAATLPGAEAKLEE
ncbi:MAG: hypothetical protein BWK77_06305 [Verrucomicrobia bacterium A1]|nr:MAG: hypothetical protein BWK77_06305 [Verrucomicrobia bacterium A1]